MRTAVFAGVLLAAAVGTQAGRDCLADVVRVVRRIAGSQTVQSAAGLVGGQAEKARREHETKRRPRRQR